MSRSPYFRVACWLVCVAMIGGLTVSAYALDKAYNFVPMTYYDPVTKTKTPFFAFGWYSWKAARMDMMAANGANTSIVFAGADPVTGAPYVYLETLGGGMGGRSDRDGKDGVQVHITNTSNLPIEAIEME